MEHLLPFYPGASILARTTLLALQRKVGGKPHVWIASWIKAAVSEVRTGCLHSCPWVHVLIVQLSSCLYVSVSWLSHHPNRTRVCDVNQLLCSHPVNVHQSKTTQSNCGRPCCSHHNMKRVVKDRSDGSCPPPILSTQILQTTIILLISHVNVCLGMFSKRSIGMWGILFTLTALAMQSSSRKPHHLLKPLKPLQLCGLLRIRMSAVELSAVLQVHSLW